jgi:hypothetical protein
MNTASVPVNAIVIHPSRQLSNTELFFIDQAKRPMPTGAVTEPPDFRREAEQPAALTDPDDALDLGRWRRPAFSLVALAYSSSSL